MKIAAPVHPIPLQEPARFALLRAGQRDRF
jgi:hypothetical protein